MDKTQGIGVLLLFIVFAGYFYLTAPSEAEVAEAQRVQDSIALVKAQETGVPTAPIQAATPPAILPSDSTKVAALQNKYGDFGSAMVGENQNVVIENNKVKLTLSSKGGVITEALIKDHYKITEDAEHNQTKSTLALMEDEKNKFEYLIPTQSNGIINTADLNFVPQVNGNQVTMTASLGSGKSLVQKYTLSDSSYIVDHALQFNGVNQMLDPSNNRIKFRWHHYLDRLELNTNFEKYYSSIYFKEVDESSDYCNCRSDDTEELDDEKLEWISHVNQFFNTSIIGVNKKFEKGKFETVLMDSESADMKLLKSEYEIPLDLVANESIETKMYIGPNEFEELRKFDNKLEEIIPFGRSLFGSINRWIIRPAFNFLSGLIGSKGVVIIVLIFILKMLLYPLMYKMLHSQAKMGLLKPEIAGLKEKFGDDSQKIQMETMKMYREYGVSPLGGCMPMLLQMPIWYALFRFFPASITFRQESFLWANDLSSFDVFARLPFEIPAYGAHISLFTLLWALTTIIYAYYNMRHMDTSANPAIKYVQYFMPITFLFFFNSYASGLTVYMFFSNVFNILQTILTKKFVFKDEKLRAELNANKSKPKKKGGFQERLEEAMKQQKELANKTNQTKKKKKR
jgi:YidC/Oxa1 family membrane protein insertase